MKLTTEERTFLVEHVFKNNGRYTTAVQQLFNEHFPNTETPHRISVYALIDKFRNTGSVLDYPRHGRPQVLDEVKLEQVSDMMLQSPKKSVRRLAQQTGLSIGSAHKALTKKLNLYPYKITVTQQLKETDYEKRIQYCEWVQAHPHVMDITFFSDEAWFTLDGTVNSQNNRVWCTENPYEIQESPLHSAKIGVWCSVSRRRLIGPIFFETTVNSDVYISNILRPFINKLTADELRTSHFQQDGATAHTSSKSMDYIRKVFKDRLISKPLWPARSPDLNPLDFYLWGKLKGSVYRNKPSTIDELKAAITASITAITHDELNRVIDNKIRRVELCLHQSGKHFQHLL